MAVMRCPECGGQVSNLAGACPHCGVPIRQVEAAGAKDEAGGGGLPWVRILLVLVVLGVGGAYLYHAYLKDHLRKRAGTPTVVAVPSPGAEATRPAVAPAAPAAPGNETRPPAATTAGAAPVPPEPAAPKAEPAAPKAEPAAPKAEPVAPKAEPAAPKTELPAEPGKPAPPADTTKAPATEPAAAKAAPPAPPPEVPLDAKTKERLAKFRERATAKAGTAIRDCRYRDNGLLTVYADPDKWNALDCEKRQQAARAWRDLWTDLGGKHLEVRAPSEDVLAAEVVRPASYAYPLGGPVQFDIKGCEPPAPPEGGK